MFFGTKEETCKCKGRAEIGSSELRSSSQDGSHPLRLELRKGAQSVREQRGRKQEQCAKRGSLPRTGHGGPLDSNMSRGQKRQQEKQIVLLVPSSLCSRN